MKKTALVTFFAAFLAVGAMAQSIQDGVKDIYAARYTSARTSFEKMLASNPNNVEAVYWLGQTYLAQQDAAGARTIYDKALATNGNAPLLLAGIGQVELMEGKAADARQHFEAAIAGSRNKKGADPNVLLAVGRANVDAYTEAAKQGDLDYAISKLNEAAAAAPKNPDVFIALGNAYRKKRDGGQAVQNYRKALDADPSYAVASYRQAMLYKSQVTYRQPDAWGAVTDQLNAAIAADPRFAPAYEELYYYNLLAKQDFATAEGFATKYIGASDPSVENDYLQAQTAFVQKKYESAITTAKNIIAKTNNNARPRVYRLLGYSYLGTKDTATACQYVTEFFQKAGEDDIVGQDYLLHAQSCAKGDPNAMRVDIEKAINTDSVLSRKLTVLNEAIEDAKAAGQRVLEAELRLMSYNLRGANAQPTELISYIAVPFYFGGAYQRADSIAQIYSKLAPDSIYGYYWSALSLGVIDSTMKGGLAIPSYEKVLTIAETDHDRYKSQGTRAAQILAIYYNNISNDRAKALATVDRGLAIDPTSANLAALKRQLAAAPAAAQQRPRSK